jgi:DNA-binding SARP family transcriptional activator
MLLGGFTLLHGAEEIILPASAQRLIAFLGLRERPLSRPYVAALLWPNCSSERSQADLRTALWRANRSSIPVIGTTGMRLYLRTEVQVDTRRLATLGHVTSEPVRPGLIVRLAGISLTELSYELLPDWYDEWLIEEREAIRQLRLHALEGLASEFSTLGRHAEAIHAALIAVRLEPLRETAHTALIKAYLAEGNRSEALRQFNHYRDLLAADLGVEPSDLIRSLVRDVTRQPARDIPVMADLYTSS